MMSLEQQITQLQQDVSDQMASVDSLTEEVVGKMGAIDARITAKELEVEQFIAEAAASAPVTPNMLVDTKQFTKLCGGEVDTEVDLISAHGTPWSTFLYNGTEGSGTLKIVTLDNLAEEGMALGDDLLRATNESLYGAVFRVALFDVTITSNMSDGNDGRFFVLNQGCPRFTGWNRGEFKTQSSCFTYVLEHSGDIRFYPHSNMPASVVVNSNDAGKGWVYKQASRTGWGGCHQPFFIGMGHMKVALALPYIGFGDHQDRFIWAGSVGRYSHFDHLSSEFTL
jgi:hypothetical protein